ADSRQRRIAGNRYAIWRGSRVDVAEADGTEDGAAEMGSKLEMACILDAALQVPRPDSRQRRIAGHRYANWRGRHVDVAEADGTERGAAEMGSKLEMACILAARRHAHLADSRQRRIAGNRYANWRGRHVDVAEADGTEDGAAEMGSKLEMACIL